MPIICSEEYEEDNDLSTLLLKACILLKDQVIDGEIDRASTQDFLDSVGFQQHSL